MNAMNASKQDALGQTRGRVVLDPLAVGPQPSDGVSARPRSPDPASVQADAAEPPASPDGISDLRLDVSVCPAVMPVSRRVRDLCRQFGIAPRHQTTVLVHDLVVPLRPGRILLVTGPSGTGKSAILRCIAGQLASRAIQVGQGQPHNRSAIVDQVAPDRPLAEAISILTVCGLGEPRLWLRRYSDLSDGEQFRVKLAMAMGAAAARPHSVLLVDEFCAILHRRLACAMAFNLRKMVSVNHLCLIAATTHDDLAADLQPDLLLRTGGDQPTLEVRSPAVRPISFFHKLRIAAGRVRDYKVFEGMHYRQREGLGPVDKVFVLRDGPTGQPLGVVVYGYPPLSLRLRNRVTAGAYHRNGRTLNRDFRILRRLVIHPDVRGCGLARWLVARTLRRVGTRYVECLAAMGAINPVFERAGMVRLGLAGLPERQQRARQALECLRVDPLAANFEGVVARRPAVRRIVARSVENWLSATTGRTKARIRAMTSRQLAAAYLQLMGTQPVYYLWSVAAAGRRRLRRQARRLSAGDARERPADDPKAGGSLPAAYTLLGVSADPMSVATKQRGAGYGFGDCRQNRIAHASAVVQP